MRNTRNVLFLFHSVQQVVFFSQEQNFFSMRTQTPNLKKNRLRIKGIRRRQVSNNISTTRLILNQVFTKHQIFHKKVFSVSFFDIKTSQPVKFFNENLTTCPFLIFETYSVSDFELKILERVNF